MPTGLSHPWLASMTRTTCVGSLRTAVKKSGDLSYTCLYDCNNSLPTIRSMKGSSTHSVSSSRSGSVSVRRLTRWPREMTMPPRSSAGAAEGGGVDCARGSSTVITFLSDADVESGERPGVFEGADHDRVQADGQAAAAPRVPDARGFEEDGHPRCVQSRDGLQIEDHAALAIRRLFTQAAPEVRRRGCGERARDPKASKALGREPVSFRRRVDRRHVANSVVCPLPCEVDLDANGRHAE